MPTTVIAIAALTYLTIEADALRSLLFIQNGDAANAIYLSDVPSTDTGIIIAAGYFIEMSQALGWDTNKTWYLYSVAGSTPIVIVEGYSKQAVQVQAAGAAIPPTSPLQEPVKDAPVM